MIQFFVPGIPRPGGSKIRTKGGVREAGKHTAAWRETVKVFAEQEYSEDLLDCPLQLEVLFIMPRPKKHFWSNGDLKDNAPQYHISTPDITKLLRSTEDALTHSIWRDDSCVAYQTATKVYGDKPGARITIRKLT